MDNSPLASSRDTGSHLRKQIAHGVIALWVVAGITFGAYRLGRPLPLWLPITLFFVLNDLVQPTPKGRLAWPQAVRIRFALVGGAVAGGLAWTLSRWLL